jgi:hypothetical protein
VVGEAGQVQPLWLSFQVLCSQWQGGLCAKLGQSLLLLQGTCRDFGGVYTATILMLRTTHLPSVVTRCLEQSWSLSEKALFGWLVSGCVQVYTGLNPCTWPAVYTKLCW